VSRSGLNQEQKLQENGKQILAWQHLLKVSTLGSQPLGTVIQWL
jgi:hypothetical protein